MSEREWKLGDLAVISLLGFADHGVARRTPEGWRCLVDDYLHRDGCVRHARPLAVIDYGDREQLARLITEWQAAESRDRTTLDRLQAALREFANPTPPKPEEPIGLGAVVETPGGRYVRSDVETCNPWRGPNGVPFEWDNLDGPVRVLSEGVPPC